MNRARALSPALSRRTAVVAGLAVLVLLVLGYGAAWAAVGDSVPRGTTVLGVDIGGEDPEAAERELEQQLAGRLAEPLPVRVGEDRFELDPAEAGFSLDAEATVEAAGGGGSVDPLSLWHRMFGGTTVEPVISVDVQRLEQAVAGLAEEADREPVEGDVTFEGGEVVPVPPRPGRALVQDRATDAVLRAYPAPAEPVELPTRPVPPVTGDAEVNRAITEFAQPAVAAPVTLVSGQTRIEVAPETFAPALSMAPDAEGRLEPTLDAAALEEALGDELAAIGGAPRDAEIRLVDGEPQVIPAKLGRKIEMPTLTAAMLKVLPTTGERVVQLSGATAEPDFTTEEAEALGVQEVIGEFTTYYPYAQYRETNIGRAAEIIDGTLLMPGETFSLNETVGERTRENGFTEGGVIIDGRLAEELGGGVSQVATTVFNAMFFAGLEDIEHKPHSFYISRYPEGREATVAWPVIDLRFRNDTDHGVLINTIHEAEGSTGSLTVEMWGTKEWEIEAESSGRYRIRDFEVEYDPSEECVPQDGGKGFDIDVTRVFNKGGEEVKRETFHTRYNPADQIYCQPEP